MRAVELYYNEELGQLCNASELVDTTRIARESDVQEVGKLVELVLGCAVQCPNKSDYILPIMQMDASEQASLMHTIEGLMRRFQQISPAARRNSMNHGASSPTYGEAASAEALAAQLAQALDKASALELKYLDVERENRELTDRFENALAEHQQLVDKFAGVEDERDKLLSERQSTLTRDNKKIQQIVEGEVHALTLALEEKNEELQRVKRESNERLMVLENEVRRQADELDISRSKLGQMAKLETSVNKYKKKLEEMNALRTQVKELETNNAQYLDKVLDLESTIKTMPTLKALVEKYKNQVVDLETANVEATSSLRIKDEKNRRLQEELDSALGGKEFLEQQVEELRAQLTNLQHHQTQDDEFSSDASMTGAGGSLSADVLLGRDAVGTLRERVARLERENAELRSGETPDQTRLANDLDFALKAKESLQNTVYQLQMQNEQLSEELRVTRSQHPGQSRVQIAANGPQPMEISSAEEGYAADASEVHMGAVVPATTVYATGPESITVHSNNVVPGTIVKQGDAGLSAAQAAEFEAQINRLVRPFAHADVFILVLTRGLCACMTEGRGGSGPVDARDGHRADEPAQGEGVDDQRDRGAANEAGELHEEDPPRGADQVHGGRELTPQPAEREGRAAGLFGEEAQGDPRVLLARAGAHDVVVLRGASVCLRCAVCECTVLTSRGVLVVFQIGTEMQRRTMMPQGPGAGPGTNSWLGSKRTEERAKRRQV